jgi:hypothetical protein
MLINSTLVNHISKRQKNSKWEFTKVYQDEQATKFYLSKFVYGEGGKKCMVNVKFG